MQLNFLMKICSSKSLRNVSDKKIKHEKFRIGKTSNYKIVLFLFLLALALAITETVS